MTLDVGAVDAALTTTRAVRRRLDLTRDVPDQVLLDCVDVAEQAPTGGNVSSRRWVVVRDTATKGRLAELYRQAGGQRVIEAADRIAGTGHPNERMMQGAQWLAQHLHEVPVLVIPTILGRYDGSGRPGLFDSVIQAAWSFMVALRARGLGTTWTTMHLERADEVAELLGIPADVTQICLLPVAYTIGTDLSPSRRRYPAREITYFDRYAHTLDRPHGEAPRLADGPGVTVEVDVAASPERVWELVTDVSLPARLSEEVQEAAWGEGGDQRRVGATIVARHRHPAVGEWQTTSVVTEYEAPKAFGWAVGDPQRPGASWRFTLEWVPGGCRLRFHVTLGPGLSGLSAAIEAAPQREARIIARRQDEHRRNMAATLAGIKALAEQG